MLTSRIKPRLYILTSVRAWLRWVSQKRSLFCFMGSLSIVGVKPFYVKKAEGIFRREAHLKMRYPIILGWVRSLVDYSTARSEMKRSNVFTWPILIRVIFWNLFPFFTTRRTFVRLRIKNKKIFSKSNTASIDQGPWLLFCKQKRFSNTEPSLFVSKMIYSVSSGPFMFNPSYSIVRCYIYSSIDESLILWVVL